MLNKIDGKVIGLIIFNIIFAIIIPLIANHFKWITGTDSIVFGVLVVLLLTSIELLHTVHLILDRERTEIELWQTKNNFDVKLSNIREAYTKILNFRRDIPDLFQSFFDDRTTELEKMMLETANRDELHLERSHVVSINVLLGSFKGDSGDIFRPVHFFEDNEFLFDIYAKQYFYSTHKLLRENKISSIKRLMVYEDEEELKEVNSIKLMNYHEIKEGYSFRVMRKKDYYSMLRDHNLSVPRDFGIYGDKYVYVAEVNLAHNIVGYWARDPDTISKIIRFFEVCWDSPISQPPKDIIKEEYKNLSIEDLFI